MTKQFQVEGQTFTTSSYTQQKETDWCVGVGSPCTCHVQIADSKTKKFALPFDNGEFAALISAMR